MTETRIAKLSIAVLTGFIILLSIAGLITTNKPINDMLIFKVGLEDVAFILLFTGWYIFQKGEIEQAQEGINSLKWRDRVRVRRAFNRGKLPKEPRLKSAALKYARGQIKYTQSFTGGVIGPVFLGLLLAAELVLFNTGFSLLRSGHNYSVFTDVPFIAIAGVGGVFVGYRLRKRSGKAVLAKGK